MYNKAMSIDPSNNQGAIESATFSLFDNSSLSITPATSANKTSDHSIEDTGLTPQNSFSEIPNVVGMTKTNAVNAIIKAGYDYTIYYEGNAAGATEENNDKVHTQSATGAVVAINVWQFVGPIPGQPTISNIDFYSDTECRITIIPSPNDIPGTEYKAYVRGNGQEVQPFFQPTGELLTYSTQTSPNTISVFSFPGNSEMIVVRAENRYGVSLVSNSGIIEFKPRLPQGLIVSPQNGSAWITFNAPYTDSNTTYMFEDINFPSINSSSSTSPIHITGLTNGVTYNFRYRSCRYNVYSNWSTSTVSVTPAEFSISADILIVAGGGGGGSGTPGWNDVGGGGGGGGLFSSVDGTISGGGGPKQSKITVARGITKVITVGAGGTYGIGPYGVSGENAVGLQGGDSSFGSITMLGGGGGAGSNGGASGGSGGGGGYSGYFGHGFSAGSGTVGQGYAGGAGSYLAGGGGGGAGSPGKSSSESNIAGDGLVNNIRGFLNVYSAGGYGGGVSGGHTQSSSYSYFGNGGGAGGIYSGKQGNQGIVVLRWPAATWPAATSYIGADYEELDGFRIYTFFGSGSITF